jgi:arylsulfatase
MDVNAEPATVPRRRFLAGAALAALGAGCRSLRLPFARPLTRERTMARPNILLVLCDDMGYSDIGCYGGEVRTPNLDRLASQGLRFSQFYNAARCCPTRASLLTGLYPHQAGMGRMVGGGPEGSPYQGYLNRQCVTLAEVLRRSGYSTLMSGKWHVGEAPENWPVKRGFDRYWGLFSGAMNYFDLSKAKAPNVVRRFAEDDRAITPPNRGFYMTDAITDHALQYLDEYGRDGDRPFFLYVAYNAPHWPLHALPEDIARYRGRYRDGWDPVRRERYERLRELGLIDPHWKLSPRDPEVPDWNTVPNQDEMDHKMAIYAAQIDRMDQGIGRILAKLDELEQAENTLVLFLSDNGACHEGGALGQDFRGGKGGELGTVDSFQSYGRSWANVGNTPFRLHKHWVHEGGISTPLIARWPAVIREGGRITHQPGHIIDIMPTCCAIAGATYPEEFEGHRIRPVEGRSLVPVLEGREREPHEWLMWEHFGNRAVRHGRWKLVAVNNGGWELYDMVEDRTETRNLATERPELVESLLESYRAWSERVGV